MKFPTLIGCILLGLAHLPSVALAGIDPLPLLIERALAAHPSVRAQEALVAASRSGVESARWQYYPTPSVSVQNASTSASDTSYQGDQRITVVGLSQPIYTWGRLSASLAKAQVQEQIALDPVPYNGGTTSLQALWMGVPVICKRGANFVSRMGASFMSAAGLPDWVAEDDAGYVLSLIHI